jgi:hypothetical protein
MLRSAQLTHRRFRLSTIGDGGTSASRLEFSIKAGHIDRPHESTTSSHELADRPK